MRTQIRHNHTLFGPGRPCWKYKLLNEYTVSNFDLEKQKTKQLLLLLPDLEIGLLNIQHYIINVGINGLLKILKQNSVNKQYKATHSYPLKLCVLCILSTYLPHYDPIVQEVVESFERQTALPISMIGLAALLKGFCLYQPILLAPTANLSLYQSGI